MSSASGRVRVTPSGGGLLSSRFTRYASQLLADNSWTVVVWDGTNWDDLGIAPVAGVITFVAPGTYAFTAFARMSASGAGLWPAGIHLDPANSDPNDALAGEYDVGPTVNGAQTSYNVGGSGRFHGGDTFDLQAFQNSGAPLTLDIASVVITKISDSTY